MPRRHTASRPGTVGPPWRVRPGWSRPRSRRHESILYQESLAMWMPSWFFDMVFEHSVVNMFLFRRALCCMRPSRSWIISSGIRFRPWSATWSAMSFTRPDALRPPMRIPLPSAPLPEAPSRERYFRPPELNPTGFSSLFFGLHVNELTNIHRTAFQKGRRRLNQDFHGARPIRRTVVEPQRHRHRPGGRTSGTSDVSAVASVLAVKFLDGESLHCTGS